MLWQDWVQVKMHVTSMQSKMKIYLIFAYLTSKIKIHKQNKVNLYSHSNSRFLRMLSQAFLSLILLKARLFTLCALNLFLFNIQIGQTSNTKCQTSEDLQKLLFATPRCLKTFHFVKHLKTLSKSEF